MFELSVRSFSKYDHVASEFPQQSFTEDRTRAVIAVEDDFELSLANARNVDGCQDVFQMDRRCVNQNGKLTDAIVALPNERFVAESLDDFLAN